MKRIHSIVFVLIVLFVGPTAALAQPRSHGYAFGGLSGDGDTPLIHVGGGGEALLYKGFGIGSELGYLAPAASVSDGIGVFSVSGTQQLRRDRSSRLIPFVTGGYTLAFRRGGGHAVHFGGGVNYWFRERRGLRLEFRDHAPLYGAHIYGFRVGLTFH